MQPSGGMPSAPPGSGYAPPPMVTGWMVPAPPPPRPHGTPSRSLFTVGAVGHFVAAGMTIPFSLFTLGFGFGLGFSFGFFSLYPIATTVLMSVGLVVQRVAFYGLWRNYGTRLGLAAFVYGLAATVTFLAAVLALGLQLFGGGPRPIVIDPIFTYFAIGSFVAFGVMFILDGCAFILARHYMNPGASISAGVLFIVAGGFVCSLLFAFFGGLLAMPALIIGGIVLVTAPIPVTYAPPADYGSAHATLPPPP